jgi:hypothetical protein
MNSIDPFFFRAYNERNYNCAHFVAEVWATLFDRDITHALHTFLTPKEARSAPGAIRHAFKHLSCPQTPCVVLMTRPHTTPHVGIYLDGKVLHITEHSVQYVPLEVAAQAFRVVKFYSCK